MSQATSTWHGWWSSMTLPIVLLYFGPPVFRFETRPASASLEGAVDIWNLFRVGWWAAVGLLAVYSLIRRRRVAIQVIRDHPVTVVSASLLILCMLLSTAFAPSALFTAANAAMMAILTVAALDLAVRIRAGSATAGTLLQGLLGTAFVLATIIVAMLPVFPEAVSNGMSGDEIRVEGGWIADTTLLGLTVLVCGAFLVSGVRRGVRGLAYLAVPASFGLLLLSRSRTVYLAAGIAMLAWGIVWLGKVEWRRAVRAIGIVSLAIAMALGSSAGLLALGESKAFDEIGTYLVRDASTLSTMSGRTTIYSVLLNQVPEHLLGSGYSAGPRAQLLASARELLAGNVIASRIGNAHNAYLELLAGAGLMALATFMVLVASSALTLVRSKEPGALPLLALLVGGAVIGMTGSDIVLPFGQASPLVWATFGFAASVRLSRQPTNNAARDASVIGTDLATGTR